jgi:predicted DNA-binding transcriptional regulator YafY
MIMSKLGAGGMFTADDFIDLLKRDEDSVVVSRRQIERDLKAIIAAGVPITSERRDRTVYYFQIASTGISAVTSARVGDPFILYLLKASLPLLRESSLQDMVDELRYELETVAPGDVLLPNTILASVSLGHYSGSVDQKILAELLSYVAQKRWIKVLYGDSHKTQLLFPFKVIPYLGRLYLAVWHSKHQRYGVYKVDGFRMVVEHPEPTPPIPKFDLDAFMSTRFGLWESEDRQCVTVVLRMTNPRLADFFLSSFWHPSQEFTQHSDGTLTIAMKAGVSPELVSWILHWAPDLQVVEPAHLSAEVSRRAHALLQRIESGQ